MEKVRLGIIGSGDHATSTLLPAIAACDNCELTHVSTTSARRAAIIRKFFPHVDISPEPAVVAQCSTVDAIIVSSPNKSHQHAIELSLINNKHVLCEKPAFLESAPAEALVQMAEMKGLILHEGFMYRFHPQYDIVRQIARQTESSFRHITVEFTYLLNSTENIRHSVTAGGGALYDVGCYAIDVGNWFAGSEPISSSIDGAPFLDGEVDQRTWFSLTYASGLTLTALAAMDLPRSNQLSFKGSNGVITLHSAFRPPTAKGPLITIEDKAGKRRSITAPAANQYKLMIHTFCNEVQQRRDLGIVKQDERWPALLANAKILEQLKNKLRLSRS